MYVAIRTQVTILSALDLPRQECVEWLVVEAAGFGQGLYKGGPKETSWTWKVDGGPQIHNLNARMFHLLPKCVFFCCSRSPKD